MTGGSALCAVIGCVALACTGCGRLSFSDRPDAPSAADDALDAPVKNYANTVLADHPVGYWRLGEASGLVARDLSGNGFDGAYQGGVVLAQPGALALDGDTAITLDGSTGFVRVPNAPQLDSLTVISAEGWVRGGVANGDQELWSAWDGGNTGYQLIYNDGRAGTWTGGGIVNASVTITDNSWHHLVAVWDGTTGYIYVDGVQQGSGAIQGTTTALENQIGTQCQGPNSTTCDRFRIGDTDDVAVYDYALPAARIVAHYNAGLGVFP